MSCFYGFFGQTAGGHVDVEFSNSMIEALFRSKFSPELGQRKRGRAFQNCLQQRLHEELNSIAASGATSARHSHITSNSSNRKIKNAGPQNSGMPHQEKSDKS